MKYYTYTGIDEKGSRVKGFQPSQSEYELATLLRRKGIRLISAEPEKSRSKGDQKRRKGGNKKVNLESLAVFSRELSTILGAGIQIIDGLEVLCFQRNNKGFESVLKNVIEDIKGGLSFSAALKMHPKTFPPLFTSLVKAAEIGGGMEKILNQLADYLENTDNLQKKIRSSTTYPKFILGFFLLVLGAVLTFLIPKFKEIFETFGAQLPTPTIILIGISDFLKRNIVYELGFLITFIASFKIISNTEKGKSLIDYIKLKLPGLGPLILKSYIIKFCSTLSTLVSNGVTLVQALEISGETTENVIFRREIEKIKKGVVEGKKFSNLMSDSSIFPEVMVKMIEIGEESGSLDMMLKKVSEFYRRQLDTAISGLTSLIEPVIMVLLGIFAMAVVIALYLPIFKISGTIR